MGHPRKLRSKYSNPRHPWQKERIEEEKDLRKKYGFRRKNEIWKMESFLGRMKGISKKLIASHSAQAEKEALQLIKKAASYGLVKQNPKIEDVLAIRLDNVLERRLQTLIMKKKFAKSMMQARQFITHGHVMVKGKTINSPSYLVKLDEEDAITFRVTSALNSDEHPARRIENAVSVSAAPANVEKPQVVAN